MGKIHLKKLLVFALLGCPALLAEKVPGRYIVELSTEPVIDHVSATLPAVNAKKVKAAAVQTQLRSAAAVSHRARIQAEHQRMRAQFEQRNVKVLDAVDTV